MKIIIIQKNFEMSKEVDYCNRDWVIQLGIATSTLRRIRGMLHEGLAEKQVSADHF